MLTGTAAWRTFKLPVHQMRTLCESEWVLAGAGDAGAHAAASDGAAAAPETGASSAALRTRLLQPWKGVGQRACLRLP